MTNEFDENMYLYNGEMAIRRLRLMAAIDDLTWKDNYLSLRAKLRAMKKSYQFELKYAKLMSWIQLPKNQDIKEKLRNQQITVNGALVVIVARRLWQEDWDWFYSRDENGEIVSNG